METICALGIETSCDETAVAVVEADAQGCRLLGESLATRPEEHARLGGIIPELTARQHLELLPKITAEVRGKIGRSGFQVVGATAGPGLAPALLVGLSFGKGLAWAENCAFHAINHLEGHLFSPFVSAGVWPEYPHLSLIISGGHTLLVDAASPTERRILGTTRDDAAGEAFDKLARMVGLGYPGGPAMEIESRQGKAGRYLLPRPMKGSEGCDFSFSGLKNAARLLLVKNPDMALPGQARADFCAEVQAAIEESVADRCERAFRKTDRKLLTVSGGVSANRGLVRALEVVAHKSGVKLRQASAGWNTDNASMVAAVTARRALDGVSSDWERDVDPRWSVSA